MITESTVNDGAAEPSRAKASSRISSMRPDRFERDAMVKSQASVRWERNTPAVPSALNNRSIDGRRFSISGMVVVRLSR